MPKTPNTNLKSTSVAEELRSLLLMAAGVVGIPLGVVACFCVAAWMVSADWTPVVKFVLRVCLPVAANGYALWWWVRTNPSMQRYRSAEWQAEKMMAFLWFLSRMLGTLMDGLFMRSLGGGVFSGSIMAANDRLVNFSKKWVGEHVFDYPNPAVQGIQQTAVVRIPSDGWVRNDALIFGLSGPAIVKGMTTRKMKVALVSEKFERVDLSTPEQQIPDFGFAEWRWLVTPLKAGTHSLRVQATLCLESEAGVSYRDLPPWPHEIRVKRNVRYAMTKFWEKNWQWVIGLVIGNGMLLFVLGKCVPNAPTLPVPPAAVPDRPSKDLMPGGNRPFWSA